MDILSLLNPQLGAQAKDEALTMGGLQAIAQLLAASGAQQRPVSAGQAIGSAFMGGLQGYQSSMDRSLQEMLKATQIQEMQRKQQEAEALKKLMVSAAVPQYTYGAGEAGPTKEMTGFTYDINKVAPALYAMGKPELVKQMAESQKLLDGKGELTGEYANVALGLFGTSDVGKLPKGAYTAIADEIARQNKAKATTVNMPSEGERKAGTLANIIDKNIAQMQAAVGKEPKAVKPNALAESVRSITGSDYLARNLSSDQRQIIEGAQLDVLDAALTLRTGAAYTREQLEGYRKSYFPQVGEPESVVKAKQVRLENLLDSAYMAAGRATPSRVSGKGETTEAPVIKPMFRFDPVSGKLVENK